MTLKYHPWSNNGTCILYIIFSLNNKLSAQTNNKAMSLHAVIYAIFFPRVILYNFVLFFAHLWWFGVLEFGSYRGYLGWGFQLMGFGACGVGPSGYYGLGLSI